MATRESITVTPGTPASELRAIVDRVHADALRQIDEAVQ